MTGGSCTWDEVKLGEALDALLDHRGKTPGKLGGDFVESGVPAISAIHIKGGQIDFSRRERFVTHEMFERWMPERLRHGDVLMTSEAPLGSLALVPSDAPLVLSQRLFALRGRAGYLDNRYLRWFLESPLARRQLDERSSGSTVTGIRQAELRQLRVPVPPIDEQRRIIEILEDHLSRLDAADAQISIARRRLEAFQLACMRRALVREPDWVIAPISDWLETSIGGLWGSEPGSDEVDVQVIRVTELKELGRLEPGTAATRSVTRSQLASRGLRPGDLLLEKSGGGPRTPVGRVGLVKHLEGPSICANFMQLMRPDETRVDPNFLHYALNAFHLSGGTAGMQTASTNIRNIKASEYLQAPIASPDLESQRKLARRITDDLEGADRIALAARYAQQRVASLRRSLLAAAFSGRLTGRAADTEHLEEDEG
jgi:type I restriction enzyme S subunit